MHQLNRKVRYFAQPCTVLCGIFLFFICAVLISPSHVIAQEGAEKVSALELLKSKRVTVRVDGLSVAMFLRSIGKRGGVNVFVDDAIKGTITINFEDISLYDLFMVVMESKQLKYTHKNGVIYVGEKGVLPTITTQICPKNGTASEYVAQLHPFLSGKGTLTVSERDNCLILQDNEEVVGRIKEMLSRLDLPISQVHIKASIVAVSKEAQRQLGIKWNYSNYRDSAIKASKNKTITAAAGSVSSTPGNLNLVFGMLQENLNLEFELNALQKDGLALVLSSPQILVLDGKQATIKQGKEVSYVATTDNVVNTSFKEANLSLEVTPKIQGKLIAMKLQVNNDNVDNESSTGEPLINTQQISTDLILKDGVTAVIGGIILHSDKNDKDRVPGLSRIPILGHLFKSSDKKKERTELLVFITANIIPLDTPMAMPSKATQYLDEYGRIRLLSGEKMGFDPSLKYTLSPEKHE